MRSTNSPRWVCSASVSRLVGWSIITDIGTSSLIAPSSIWKICRIVQSFSTIILPSTAQRVYHLHQTEDMHLSPCQTRWTFLQEYMPRGVRKRSPREQGAGAEEQKTSASYTKIGDKTHAEAHTWKEQ